MMCYYKWAVWQRAAISGCGEVWYRAWMGFKRPWVRISTLGPKISLRFGVGIFFCSYYRELKASCIWINGHRPWRRSAAGRPWVRISTLGPSNDNPNYIIQVGNVFGFIISIENIFWRKKGRDDWFPSFSFSIAPNVVLPANATHQPLKLREVYCPFFFRERIGFQ